MVLQLVLLFSFACGKEDEARVVSEATYPGEYAEMYCRIQVDCERTDLSIESCTEQIQSSMETELASGCFNERAAVECLDILEVISCADFEDAEKGAWDVCGDVDVCD